MSSFGGLILTNKGKSLQSKAQAGVQLNFTRIGIGDGNLGSQSILALNSLVSEVKSLNITKLKFVGSDRSVVGGTLSNQEITTGFYFRELGVFADDPDLGEVLYCYGNAGELAEYIPSGGQDIIEKTIDVDMFIGNAENVTATIDESLVFATVQQLDEHKNDLENPHNVTKNQVGLENVDNVKQASEADLLAHVELKVSDGEIHGFRLTDGKLEYFDGTEWQRVRGDGYPVGSVTNFNAKSDNQQAILTWTDPDDVTVEDSNGDVITISRWKGTRILRKTTDFPENENDGVLVVDNGVRNQYETSGFVDSGLVNGTTYYYSAFSYTQEDVFDTKTDASVIPVEQRIYGVRVDKNNSNPETRATYISDAVGFAPMRGNNGAFDWGSWTNILDDYEIKPCLLQNGVVNYYLNPENYAQKDDLTAPDLSGVDGDVTIEFGKTLWWKWTDEGTTYTIEISDKAFPGAVKHAFEVEDGYNLANYYPLLLMQNLFIILFKSTDSQSALGRGRVDSGGYVNTGGTNAKGMFYGSESDEQMKFLGIEDFWGNRLWWIDGIVTDSSYNLLIGKTGFNDSGNGYTSYSSGVSSDVSGYISEVQGGNDKGFITKASSGSETTYYADYGYLYSSRVANFGGGYSNGSSSGFVALRLGNSSSDAGANIGARLFCASNGKIYIGAYLATTISGKLRSVSNTTPANNKTINAFRTEARANN